MAPFYLSRTRLCLFGALLALNSLFGQQVAKPTASIIGGKFTTPQTITLSTTTPNAALYYTTDGNEADSLSRLYTGPLSINSTTTLRTRAYATGLTSSALTTHTYFINVNHTFPIVALSFKPDDFFSPTTGLYPNFSLPIEVPVNVELIETNSNRAAFSAALKTEIQGSTSAQLSQKSLEIKAGGTGLAYPVFPTQPFTSYRRFVLRNSGQDWGITMFRDAMVQSLALRVNDLGNILATPNLILQDYRPSVVYFNGQYWGIHNIRERMNRFYIEQHFNIPLANFDLIENWGAMVNNGDSIAFTNFYSSLRVRNFTSDAAFESLKNEIDITNFMDYNVFNVLIDNEDWPSNNVRCFKPKTGGKWRWLSYDHDFSFGLFSPLGWNTGDPTQNSIRRLFNSTDFVWPNDYNATLLFRKCSENATFRRDFINRAADFLNTMLKSNRVTGRINEFETAYTPEMPQHSARWGSPYMNIFNQNVDKMRSFANARPAIVRQQFDEQFSEITGSADITLAVSPTDGGTIEFSTLNLSRQNLPFTGTYFTGVDIPARAVAAAGYRFDRWSDASLGTTPSTLVRLSNNKSLTAIFVPISNNPCATDVVPPTFTTCPQNISLKSLTTCATANWATPTATDNCTTSPSVSGTYASGFCFPKGTTTVTYSATDAANNRSTCSFTVTVADSTATQTGGCKRFSAANVNDVCYCPSPTYQPYALTFDLAAGQTTCLGTSYQNENLILEQTSPTTATLKGAMRSNDFTLVLVDIQLSGGTSNATALRSQCLANQPISVSNGWFYYTQMSGTIKIGAAAPLSITLNNAPFQIGKGANLQRLDAMGASTRFKTGDGRAGWLQIGLTNEQAIACGTGGGGTNTTCDTDTQPPTLVNCPQNITLTTATNCAVANWTPPTATDNCASTPSVFGLYASGTCFPIGTTNVIYTAVDNRNNSSKCSFAVSVQTRAIVANDLELTIAATPTSYRQYTALTYKVTARNLGTTPYTNVKIEFKYPTGTAKGGTVVPSIGTWDEYCFGAIACFEWSIPSLAANASATLTVPLFTLGTTAPLVGTALLKTSTPIDNNSLNNTATATVPFNAPVAPLQLVAFQRPTQQVPIVIQKIYPNPANRDISVDLESLTDRNVIFSVYNTLGKQVAVEERPVKKGQNTLVFDIFNLETGLFYIVPETNVGHNVPTKFVKFE